MTGGGAFYDNMQKRKGEQDYAKSFKTRHETLHKHRYGYRACVGFTGCIGGGDKRHNGLFLPFPAHSVQMLSFTVKKAEFFAVLETAVQNGHISPADTNALVGSLREIYYRVPTVLAHLVVQAFQQDRLQKAASIGGDI